MMKFNSFFLFFASVFLFSDNVEATLGLPSNANDLLNVVTNNLDGLQLPINSPLKALGTTACSTYPHANVGVLHFEQLCYTQKWVYPNVDFPYKCRTNKFIVGIPLLEVPFKLPTIVGFMPQAGYSETSYVSKVDGSRFYYNATFVEAQTAEPLYYVTNGVNVTLLRDSVITHYTNKGYVHLICPLTDLKKPLCSSPEYIAVCTYERDPPPSDVDALVQPLNAYPYYVGKNLVDMDQTGC